MGFWDPLTKGYKMPNKRGSLVCLTCKRDFDTPAKGNRCPYCKSILPPLAKQSGRYNPKGK